MASTRRPGSPSGGAATPASSSASTAARRASTHASRSSAAVTERSLLRHLERGRARRAARLRAAQQELDLLLGAVQDRGAATAQLHPLLERAQAVLERQVATLEALDQ